MPEAGIPDRPPSELLSFAEIADVVRAGAGLGINKIRLTGGEPLLREGIAELIGMLSRIPGITDLALTTNGQLLAGYAEDLRRAGLHRINVSLDTVDHGDYSDLTGGGDLHRVLEGLRAADKAGLTPIKLNCVVLRSSEEPRARAVADYARGRGYGIRFIRKMDLQRGLFWKVEGGKGGDCPACDRLRLSSDGNLYPCLFNTVCFNVRELGSEESLRRAVGAKPAAGTISRFQTLVAIGG